MEVIWTPAVLTLLGHLDVLPLLAFRRRIAGYPADIDCEEYLTILLHAYFRDRLHVCIRVLDTLIDSHIVITDAVSLFSVMGVLTLCVYHFVGQGC